MTRGMFFKVLAAIGLGQTIRKDEHGRKLECTTMWPNSASEICTTLECGPGEETCPLRHCQKPRAVAFLRYFDKPCMDRPADGENCVTAHELTIEQHVCATCGIVYVPVKP
jgi:hypothetical protein